MDDENQSMKDIIMNLAKKSLEGQREGYSNAQTSVNNTLDRMRMANPEVQGPRLPNNTPEEQSFYDNNANVAMGSISSGNGGKALKKTIENIGEIQQPTYSADKLQRLKGIYEQIMNRGTIGGDAKQKAMNSMNQFERKSNLRGIK